MKAFAIVSAIMLVILGVAMAYLGWQRDRERAIEPTAIFKARQEALLKSQAEARDAVSKSSGGSAAPGDSFGVRPLPGLPTPKTSPPPLLLATPKP